MRRLVDDGVLQKADRLVFARTGRKQESEEHLAIAIRLEHEEAKRRRIVFRIPDLGPPLAQGASSPK